LLPIFSELQNSSVQSVPAISPQTIAPVSDVNAVSEPAEKPVSARVIRKVGSSFTPSIKDALAGNVSVKNAENEVQKSIFTDYQQLSESFTATQLAEAWNKFLGTISDRPNLKSTLSVVPEIDETRLILRIGNSVQEEEIRLVKPELVSWLRNELKNSEIEIITRLERIESERVIFSDSEKMKMMIQKNPELLNLKQRFNLDFKD